MYQARRSSRSEFVPIRNLQYHVRLWGTPTPGQAPLVMVHGWMDVAASYQFVVDAFAEDRYVIAPDWRGYGLTEVPHADNYWFPDYLADLDFLIDHYAGNQPVDLVGHSMGGNIAMLYGGARPGRIRRLVNLEGFGLRPTRAEDAPERYRKWLDQIRAGSRYRHYADRDAFAARLRQENPRLTGERAVFLAEHMAQPGGEGLVPAADPCHRWVNPVLYRLEEAMACWRQATARVLWVRGDDSFVTRDFAGREEDYRRRLACFAGAREIVVPECGHNLHHDRPEVVARIIEEFFA